MKYLLQNLSSTNKLTRLFIAGLIIFSILFFYSLNRIEENLKSNITIQKKELVELQRLQKNIDILQDLNKPSRFKNFAEMNDFFQKKIRSSEFVKNTLEIREINPNTLRIVFQNVNFDKWIAWLIPLWQETHFKINTFSGKPAATPGTINVEMEIMLAY